MCVLTIGSFSLFGKKWKIVVNYKSDLGFVGFLRFSISLFILIIYKGNHFGAPPPPPSPLPPRPLGGRPSPRGPSAGGPVGEGAVGPLPIATESPFRKHAVFQ